MVACVGVARGRSNGYRRGVDLGEIEAVAPSGSDLGEIEATEEVTRERSPGGGGYAGEDLGGRRSSS